jgi:hypothetical protein
MTMHWLDLEPTPCQGKIVNLLHFPTHEQIKLVKEKLSRKTCLTVLNVIWLFWIDWVLNVIWLFWNWLFWMLFGLNVRVFSVKRLQNWMSTVIDRSPATNKRTGMPIPSIYELRRCVAIKDTRFQYTFSHGGLWLKRIPHYSILFSHARRSVAKKHIRFHYTFSHGGLWLKGVSDFIILLATAVCG